MTEAEWQASTDPTPMLAFLQEKASSRKLRLFAVACCRRRWTLIRRLEFQSTVNVAEQYADGHVSIEKCREMSNLVVALFESTQVTHNGNPAELAVVWTAMINNTHDYITQYAEYASTNACRGRSFYPPDKADSKTGRQEKARQAILIRDIFGNLFHSITFKSSWFTSTTIDLAAGMYENRAFDRLPILADALEEAGCDNDAILTHCRSEGPHVRGCWVIDLLLGKS